MSTKTLSGPELVAATLTSLEGDARREALAVINATTDADYDARTRGLVALLEKRDQQPSTREMAEPLDGRALALRVPDKPSIDGDALREERNCPQWSALLPSATESRAAALTSDQAAFVPLKTADAYVDRLRVRSAFLNPAAGVQVLRWEGGDFKVPMLSASTKPAFAAEGQALPELTPTSTNLTFKAIKFGGYKFLSSELLDDSAVDLRRAMAETFVRDMAVAIDDQAWNGNGTNALKGLLAAGQATKTTLGAGKVSVSWSDVLDAYGAIESTGGKPTVIWASPDMATGLRKERENGTTGAYLAGSVTASPTTAGVGLPLLVAGNLPAKTVLVADGSRVFVGIRRDVTVKVDESAGFTSDTVGFKVTARLGGVSVAEATSVQWIQAATS